MVVPEIGLPPFSSDIVNYVTHVEGLKVNYDCEVLQFADFNWVYQEPDKYHGNFVANITNRGCAIRRVDLVPGSEDDARSGKASIYSAQFAYYPCNTSFDYANVDTKWFPPVNEEDSNAEHRLLMVVSERRFLNRNESQSIPGYGYVHRISGVLCKSSYFLGQFEVQKPRQSDGSANAHYLQTPGYPKRKLEGFRDDLLGQILYHEAEGWNLGTGVDTFSYDRMPIFFRIMSWMNGNSTLEPFLNSSLLVNLSTHICEGISTQILRNIALKPRSNNLTGNITWVEDRLKTDLPTITALSGIFLVLFAASITTIYICPMSAVPIKPHSIASIAAILAFSPSFDRMIKKANIFSLDKFRAIIGRTPFQSAWARENTDVFSIEPALEEDGPLNNRNSDKVSNSATWWCPFASTLWFLLIAAILPIASIIVLELTQQWSDKHNGFLEIDSSILATLILYIPTVISLIISAIYAGLEFNISLLAPFAALRKGKAKASQSLKMQLGGKFLPHALYLSLKAKNYAVAMALIGNFVAGFLVIVVSGLFKPIDTTKAREHTMFTTDKFNFNITNLDLGDEVPAVASLVEFSNLSYPKWTYQDLVFNHLNYNSSEQAANMTFAAKLPAIKPKLRCASVKDNNRVVTSLSKAAGDRHVRSLDEEPTGVIVEPSNEAYIVIKTSLETKDWCEFLSSGNSSHTPITASLLQYFPAILGSNNTFALSDGLKWYENGRVGGTNKFASHYTYTGPDSPRTIKGCPSFSMTLGSVDLSSVTNFESMPSYNLDTEIVTILCHLNLEEVFADVQFTLPHFELNMTPRPDEESAKLLYNTDAGMSFDFTAEDLITGLPSDGDFPTGVTWSVADSFMLALLHAKEKPPLESLLGKHNAENLSRAVSRVSERYIAQAISLNARTNVEEGGPVSFNGTLTSKSKRLQQSRETKIATQIMLAIIVVCATASRLLMPVQIILPHCPNSIAGTALLLSGSSLTEERAVSSQLKNKESLASWIANMIDERTFSLKWWPTAEGNQRYYIDVDTDDTSGTKMAV